MPAGSGDTRRAIRRAHDERAGGDPSLRVASELQSYARACTSGVLRFVTLSGENTCASDENTRAPRRFFRRKVRLSPPSRSASDHGEGTARVGVTTKEIPLHGGGNLEENARKCENERAQRARFRHDATSGSSGTSGMAIESHRPWFFEYHVSTQLSTQRAEILAHWLVNECVFLTDEAGAALKLNEDILHADVLRFGSLFSRLMFRAAPCRASIAARERTHARQRLIVANNSRIFLRHVQGSCSRDALVRRDQPRLPHIFRSPPPLSPIESFASTPPSFRASPASLWVPRRVRGRRSSHA